MLHNQLQYGAEGAGDVAEHTHSQTGLAYNIYYNIYNIYNNVYNIL